MEIPSRIIFIDEPEGNFIDQHRIDSITIAVPEHTTQERIDFMMNRRRAIFPRFHTVDPTIHIEPEYQTRVGIVRSQEIRPIINIDPTSISKGDETYPNTSIRTSDPTEG